MKKSLALTPSPTMPHLTPPCSAMAIAESSKEAGYGEENISGEGAGGRVWKY